MVAPFSFYPNSIIFPLGLVILLRIIGTTSILALPSAFLPYAWMNAIHQWLGLVILSPDPILDYLARTLLAFHAVFGGHLWVFSFDTSKCDKVIHYVGFATLVFGFILLGVDRSEEMSFYLKLFEDPIVIL